MECNIQNANRWKIGSKILLDINNKGSVLTTIDSLSKSKLLNTENINILLSSINALFNQADSNILNYVKDFNKELLDINKFTDYINNLNKLPKKNIVNTVFDTTEEDFRDTGTISKKLFENADAAHQRLLIRFREELVNNVLFNEYGIINNNDINDNLLNFRNSLKERFETFNPSKLDLDELNRLIENKDYEKVDHYLDAIIYKYFDDLLSVYGKGIISISTVYKDDYSDVNKYSLAQQINIAKPFKKEDFNIEKVIPEIYRLLIQSTHLVDSNNNVLDATIEDVNLIYNLAGKLEYENFTVEDIKKSILNALKDDSINTIDKSVLRGIYKRFFENKFLEDSTILTLITNQFAIQPISYGFLEYDGKNFKLRFTDKVGTASISEVEQTVDNHTVPTVIINDNIISTELGNYHHNNVTDVTASWEEIVEALKKYVGIDLSSKMELDLLSNYNKDDVVRYIYKVIANKKGIIKESPSTQAIDGFKAITEVIALIANDYAKSTVTKPDGKQSNKVSLHNKIVSYKRDIKHLQNKVEEYKKLGKISVFNNNPFFEGIFEKFILRSTVSKYNETKSPTHFNVKENIEYTLNYAYFQTLLNKGKALFDITTFSDKPTNPLALISGNGKYSSLFDFDYFPKGNTNWEQVKDWHYNAIREYYINLERNIIDTYKSMGFNIRSINGINKKLKDYTEYELTKLASDNNVDLVRDLMYVVKDDKVLLNDDLIQHFKLYKDSSLYNEYMLNHLKNFIKALKTNNYKFGVEANTLSKNLNITFKGLSKNKINSFNDVHPLLLKYFFDWNFISENMMNTMVGTVFGHAGNNPANMWVKQTKRNVIISATGHRYVLGLKNGVEDVTITAIVEDPTEELINELGNQTTQDVADGSAWSLPSAHIKAQNSLGGSYGQQIGTHIKPIYHEINPLTGAFKFTKLADFRLTNFRIRNSAKKLSVRRLIKKMMSNEINVEFNINDLDIPVMINNTIKHINSIIYNGINYTRTFNDNSTDTININTMYDLWVALGGENSMSIIGSKSIYNVNNVNYKYSDSSWEALVEIEAEYPEIKGNYISRITLVSSQKTGVTNVNDVNTLYNDEPFSTTTIDNRHSVIQLNAEHKTDESDLSAPTQFISALIFGLLTKDKALNVYNTLNELAQVETNDLLIAEDQDLIDIIFKDLKDTYERNGDTNNEAYKYIVAFEGKKMSIDTRMLFNRAITNIANIFTNKGIKNKLDGLIAVIAPDTFDLYQLPKGTKYVNSRGQEIILQEDRFVDKKNLDKWKDLNEDKELRFLKLLNGDIDINGNEIIDELSDEEYSKIDAEVDRLQKELNIKDEDIPLIDFEERIKELEGDEELLKDIKEYHNINSELEELEKELEKERARIALNLKEDEALNVTQEILDKAQETKKCNE